MLEIILSYAILIKIFSRTFRRLLKIAQQQRKSNLNRTVEFLKICISIFVWLNKYREKREIKTFFLRFLYIFLLWQKIRSKLKLLIILSSVYRDRVKKKIFAGEFYLSLYLYLFSFIFISSNYLKKCISSLLFRRLK